MARSRQTSRESEDEEPETGSEAKAETDEGASSRLPVWLEWIIVVACGVGLALLIRTFVCEVYLVPSGSMLETIQEGDRLLGEKISPKASGVSAGEIVTFDDPDQPGVTLIKRVIATAGQTVDLRDGTVYVDGEPLDEDYTLGKPSYPLDSWSEVALDGPISYPYTVPEGSVWVMGDNRTNSLDSRYFGAVPVSSISSHAAFIFWPLTDARRL